MSDLINGILGALVSITGNKLMQSKSLLPQYNFLQKCIESQSPCWKVLFGYTRVVEWIGKFGNKVPENGISAQESVSSFFFNQLYRRSVCTMF